MADNKTKPTKLSVAAYIDALTDETKRADAKALVKLMQSATGERPKMWGPSIVGFGSYHYTYESGREGDMPLAGFSPRKAATVLYGEEPHGEADEGIRNCSGLEKPGENPAIHSRRRISYLALHDTRRYSVFWLEVVV
jgi:hypothetical protein